MIELGFRSPEILPLLHLARVHRIRKGTSAMSIEQAADDKQLIKELERRSLELQGHADKLNKEVESLQADNTRLNQQLESQRAETHQMQMMLDQAHRDIKMQYLGTVKSFPGSLNCVLRCWWPTVCGLLSWPA